MISSSPWIVTFLMMLSPAIQAETSVAPQMTPVENAVASYLERQKTEGQLIFTHFELGKLDPRLKLADCSSPLQISEMQKNGRYLRLKIRCESPKPWQVHLPVTLQKYEPVIVAKESLPKQQVIQPKHLQVTTVDTSELTQSFYQDESEIIGKVAKQTIPSGSIIGPQLITNPQLVRRGEHVLIVAHQAGLVIRARGIAMDDGTLGDKIKVKNVDTGRTIDAFIAKEGQVEIELRSMS